MGRTSRLVFAGALAAILVAALDAASGFAASPLDQRPADFSRPEQDEALSAGAATSTRTGTRNAFSLPSANMPFERQLDFKVGDGIFRKLWVSAPSSTKSSDGLGPLFNSRSCQGCHLKDGRGNPPAAGEDAVSFLLRLSVPPRTEQEKADIAGLRHASIPEQTYGGQLQTFAIQGHKPEGRVEIDFAESAVTLADGHIVRLRKPTYRIVDLGYGPMDEKVMISPRIAPPMIGLGLLEMIPEDDILAAADRRDHDNDGISGKANWVWSEQDRKLALGRFGWKAGEPTILQQTSHAFAADIGLSSALTPSSWGDCTENQPDCRKAANGADPEEGVEVTAQMMDLILFYSRNLAVPARRHVGDAEVLRGKKVFHDSGCAACHRPSFVTRNEPDRPEHSNQRIWPYTDLLLHDMGVGLADGRPDGAADEWEWRTPPLWGIGLTETVSGHSLFLHDGRARNLLEAILWHGGEAEPSKQRVVALSTAERNALLAFLKSL